ncbi:metallophosphoesterase [Salibacterium aidingense]|uniref:metallophosphoesterase n=1 Tax=Salibacterium aidingense TaxID=384933 RepID=UPI00041755B0|nr:metallophosphoesterase [Salibacterium aidingense]
MSTGRWRKTFSSFLSIVLISTFLFPITAITTNAASAPSDLIISEYVMEVRHNKAVELYNGTDSEMDVSEYTLERYSGDADSAEESVQVSGSLASGGTYVLYHGEADGDLKDKGDLENSSVIDFNGRDSVVLRKAGDVIDSIGQAGAGEEWGKDVTLIRNGDVRAGDTTMDDAFDPSEEWEQWKAGPFDDLGSHHMNDPVSEAPGEDEAVPDSEKKEEHALDKTSSNNVKEITEPYIVLEDFEDGIGTWQASGARYNSIDALVTNEEARHGSSALQLDYDFIGTQGTSGVYASKDNRIEIPGNPEKIGMWIYGDGNKHWLRQQLYDANGQNFNINYTSDYPNGVTWKGWKYVEANIPSDWEAPFRIDLAVRYMATDDDGKTAGTIYVDNIQAVYDDFEEDVTNPALENFQPLEDPATSNQPEISAVAEDNQGGSGIDPENMIMKIDEEPVTPSYDAASGKISYTPESPLAEGVHEAYIEVFDKAGNHHFNTWNFQVSAGGPSFQWEGPEQANAGSTFDVQLKMSQFDSLHGADIQLSYDPELLTFLDGIEETEALQVQIAEKFKGKTATNEVNSETGEIQLSWDNLADIETEEEEVLATITFELGMDASGEAELELSQGSLSYVDSSIGTIEFFAEPFRAGIAQPLVLSIEGKSVNTPSRISVADQDGYPVEGAEIEITNDAKLLEVTNSTDIYKGGSGVAGDPYQEVEAGTYLPFANYSYEGFEYYRIFIPNGEQRYYHVPEEDVREVEWNSLFGTTDENGEMTTDLLTLSQIPLTIQASKGELVSQVESIDILPQLGGPTPSNIALTWLEDPKTTQHFTWRTGTMNKDSVVEVVAEGEEAGFESSKVQRFEGENELYSDDTGEMRIHRTQAIGLTPGTTYHYRVGDGTESGWSEESTFTTESTSDQPFNFLFFADTQSQNQEGFEIWTELYELGLEKFPETDFALHAGDIVEDGSDIYQWDYFLEASQGLSTTIPFMSVLGNHDVYGDGENKFNALFPYPENGPKGKEGFVYSFAYGNANFIMLNSEFGIQDMEEQQEWVREEVENTDKLWNIAMFHRSPYSSNPLTGTDATADTFAPVLEELGVDLVLTGHDHAYMKSHLMKDGRVQTDGSGSQYIIGGSAGPKFYPAQTYDYVDVLYDEDKQVFTSIEIDGNDLRGDVYSIDNEHIDTFELQKQGDDEAVVPERSYDFKDSETGRLLVHKPSVSLTFDAASEVKNGVVFTGNYAEFHGAGLKNATITIRPEKDGALIDFKDTEISKVILDGDNISELRGIENIQEIEYVNGADPAVLTSP